MQNRPREHQRGSRQKGDGWAGEQSEGRLARWASLRESIPIAGNAEDANFRHALSPALAHRLARYGVGKLGANVNEHLEEGAFSGEKELKEREIREGEALEGAKRPRG